MYVSVSLKFGFLTKVQTLIFDHNVCSIHFLGVPINFDPIGKCHRSPKVMDIGKSVYVTYPDYLKIFTEVKFTNEFLFLFDGYGSHCR